eukprot:COSAG04_NODE_393_length_15147_cov_44.965643_14_plen_232_part_00
MPGRDSAPVVDTAQSPAPDPAPVIDTAQMEVAPAATASVETDAATESDLHRASDSATTARTPAETDETVAEVLELEQEIMQDGSEFGRALRDVLQDALPIVRSDLNLAGWLRVLSEETDRSHCQPAAELYLRLSRGWLVLPAGTVVEPQWTRNYQSALEAEQDVTAEISRLHQKGFLLTFAEAQQRFPSLRQQSRPDVVLAMGSERTGPWSRVARLASRRCSRGAPPPAAE